MSIRPLRTKAAETVMVSSIYWTRGRTWACLRGRGVRLAGRAARARSIEHVGPFRLVELHRPGDRLEDVLGHAADVALLQPGVPVRADSCQDGDLLAPQPGHPTAAAAGGQPDLVGLIRA